MKLTKLLLLAHLACVAAASAQQGGLADAPSLLMDPNGLTDDELSQVAVGIVRAKIGEWHSVPASKPIFNLMADNFALADGGPFPKTARAVEKEIERINELPNSSWVGKEKSSILIPPLPVRPKKGLTAQSWAQLLEMNNLTARTIVLKEHLDSLVTGESAPVRQLNDIRDAPNWLISFSRQEFESFHSQISPLILHSLLKSRKIYIGPLTETAEVRSRGSVGETSSRGDTPVVATAAAVPTPPAWMNLSLDPGAAGTLVILDRFARGATGDCNHGLIVSSVATQMIREYSPNLLSNGNNPIVQAEVDFFANLNASGKTLTDYIATFPSDNVRAALFQNKDAILNLKKDPNNPNVVPLFYIQALLDDSLDDPRTSVVSTSVWFDRDGFQFLPRNFDADGPSQLLSAVSDDSIDPVELSRQEPVASFLNQKSFRTLLVGGLDASGQPFGQRSTSGAICCPGSAEGWPANVTCGRVNSEFQRGTSYATPEVAAVLYMARAFWKQHGAKFDSHNMSTRLMLASQLTPTLVGGSYASAGIPRLESMLTTEARYAVHRDLSIEKLAFDPATAISLHLEGEHFSRPFLLQCGGLDGVCGLKVVNGVVYAFLEPSPDSEGKWERAIDASLNIRLADGRSFQTPASIETAFEGIYTP
jgi:hypothetical protein